MAKFKLPQLTTAQRTGLTLDAREIVYDTDEEILYYGDGSTAGGLSLVGPVGPQGPPGSGLAAVVDDTSPQLGGFLDPNGNYIGFDKGSDIASASPLIIGTDGDYFEVTGSTGFSTMTVAANRFFMLRFTGVLTITNGVPITIPGASNFTTTIGDQFLCFSTAIDTVKIVAVTKIDGTAVATNLSEDLTPQLSGFLDPNGHYIGSGKGGDIASASPLVIGIDGDFFDVTGTTGFSVMTVASNRNFTLQFDGILTITVGGGITLNNAGGNFTTAPGDVIEFQSIAANTVVGTITKADGTTPAPPAIGGAWTLINTIEADDDSTLTITGLDSTFDTYAITVSGMRPNSSGAQLQMRVGDAGGIDSGGTDYAFHTQILNSTSSAYTASNSASSSFIQLTTSTGDSAGQGSGIMIYLHRSGDSTVDPIFTGTNFSDGVGDFTRGGVLIARRLEAITLDRIQIFYSAGTINFGRFSIYGISHD